MILLIPTIDSQVCIIRPSSRTSLSILAKPLESVANASPSSDLTHFAAGRNATIAQLAIAWALANPAVDVAIVGARSPEQIRQTAPGADLQLSPEEIAQIEVLLRGEVAVGGPAPEAMPRS